jgi:hypothetical protein
MTRRSRLLLLAPVLGALVLAGCAGGGGPSTGARGGDTSVDIDTIQLAASNTQTAESTRFEIDLHSDLVDMHASGVASGDGRTGQVVVETADGRMEQRMVEGVVYVDFGDAAPGWLAPTDGKRWVKVDLGGLAGALGQAATGAFGPQTPGSALDMLQELSGDVQVVGEDEIAGHHAVHYRATVDAAGTSAPVDVWIDDQDRVVKMQVAMPEGTGELTMQITEFGAPVDVVAPPPDEVAELPALRRLGLDGIHI